MSQSRNSLNGMNAIVVLIVAVIFCGTPQANTGREAFLDGEALLVGWDANYGGLTGMEASFQQRLITPVPSEGADQKQSFKIDYNPEKPWHVEMVKDGSRYHTRVSCDETGFAKAESLREYAFDGTIGKEYFARRKSGVVHRGLNGVPEEKMESFPETYMLMWKAKRVTSEGGFTEDVPHGKALLNAVRGKKVNFTVLPQLEIIAGESCHLLELTGERGYKEKIWFAHEKGMLPLRYEWYIGDRMLRGIRVEEVGRVQTETGDFWYPARAYWTEITPGAYLSGDKDTVTFEFTMSRFVPNPKVEDNAFDLRFPVGTYVSDRITGVRYKVGLDEKLTAPANVLGDPVGHIEALKNNEPNADLNTSETRGLASKVVDIESGDTTPVAISAHNSGTLVAKLILYAGVILVAYGVFCWYRRRSGAGNVDSHK